MKKLILLIILFGLVSFGLGGQCPPWKKDKDDDHDSGSSGPVPLAPSDFDAYGTSGPAPEYDLLSITLVWVDNSLNEDGFSVERKSSWAFEDLDQAVWVVIATVGRDMTFYVDDSLPPGWMKHRIRSYNSVGYSAYSNELQSNNF